eukprot:m.60000 g.60000  ORF g.60000 m.60000 type:complete len:236 (+) comp11286_c0_seq1:176-883(+)
MADSSWSKDVLIETDVDTKKFMDTTGGKVWDAARHLCHYLEMEQKLLDLHKDGKKIIELGAGCGYLGLIIAKNIASAHVCVTEMATGGALSHLKHNIKLNQHKEMVGNNIEAKECDWIDYGDDGNDSAASLDLLGQQWDIIVGSDLVYNDIGVAYLPKVISKLASKDTTTLYCHTKHRYDMMDHDFLLNCEKEGLDVEEVWAHDETAPPPSPPPWENLFNEHRIVVWKISKKSSS